MSWRTTITKFRLWVLGLVLAAHVPSAASSSGTVLDIYEWLAVAPIPDCSKTKYVRFLDAKSDCKAAGFVMETGQGRERLVDFGVWPATCPNSDTVRREVVDLAVVADEVLARLRKGGNVSPSENCDTSHIEPYISNPIGRVGAIAVFAHYLRSAGIIDTADALMNYLAKSVADEPLLSVVKRDLEVSLMWMIVASFEDPSNTRESIRAQLDRYRRSYPDGMYCELAKTYIRALDKMAASDTHRRAGGVMAPASKAEALVLELQDQYGDQFGEPGVMVFVDSKWGERVRSPASELMLLGDAAIAPLIRAIESDGLTRIVAFGRSGVFSHRVVGIADVAVQLLESVTGVGFSDGLATRPGVDHVRQRRFRNLYEDWWASAATFLARVTLVIRQGKESGWHDTVKHVPDAWPGQIRGAPRGAAWGRWSFREAFPAYTDGELVEFLRAVSSESASLQTRTLAAWALNDVGDSEGVGVYVARAIPMAMQLNTSVEAFASVVNFMLANAPRERLVELLGLLYASGPSVREAFLVACLPETIDGIRGFSARARTGIVEPWRLDARRVDIVERTVVSMLQDLNPRRLANPVFPSLAAIDARFGGGKRVADLAVRILQLRWPSVYCSAQDELVRTDEQWELARLSCLEVGASRRR